MFKGQNVCFPLDLTVASTTYIKNGFIFLMMVQEKCIHRIMVSAHWATLVFNKLWPYKEQKSFYSSLWTCFIYLVLFVANPVKQSNTRLLNPVHRLSKETITLPLHQKCERCRTVFIRIIQYVRPQVWKAFSAFQRKPPDFLGGILYENKNHLADRH